MSAFMTAHAQLLQARDELQRARDELAQLPARGFQDAFLEALRCPYEAAARPHTSEETIIWRRSDLLDFLCTYFPQYAQQPVAFSALCELLTQHSLEMESDRLAESDATNEFVPVTFDSLKSVLVRQYGSTRLAAKDPFPLEPRIKAKSARRPSIAPFVPGSTHVKGHAPDDTPVASVPHDFQSDVMKKSKSWLGRWRARHLVLRWGVLEVHKRSLTARSFRHHSSTVSLNASSTALNSYKGDNFLVAVSPGGAATKIKSYDLENLVSIKLEHVRDDDTTSARKAALTLTFQTSTFSTQSTLSHTVTQDIKTLIFGTGEASETLVSIRDQIATFALYLELSRRDRLPFLTKIRRLIAANAMVNMRVCIPRVVPPNDPIQRRSQEKEPPYGLVTALQLAFLQDPRVPSFESTIAVLLNAGADPCGLLHWDYATQVIFTRSWSGSTEQKEDQQQRQNLRKRLLLLDKVDSEGDETANFNCCQVQADDASRWNLLMYLCWIGDVEGVHQLLSVTGLQRSSTSQSRISSRQVATCLDHVNASGDTALHVAIKSGNEAVTLALIEAILFADAQAVHQCDGRGESVVHLALNRRHWRVVDALVAGNAVDPRSYDAQGKSALHLAIELSAPVALIARLIQVYRHFSPTGGLDGRAGRRESIDTPLSLALKSGQEQVVALLLASGATPVGSHCHWSQAFIERKREFRREEHMEEKTAIGDDDSALHIAIKAGQELAAAALIAHKADIYTVDSKGSSSLALAVRYGLYALAAELVDQHQKKKKKGQLGGKNWWVDEDTRKPVVMLACQAGQLELAAFLLDCMSHDQTSQSHLYPAQILPLLVQISSWIGRRSEANRANVFDNASASRRLSSGSLEFGDKRPSGYKKTRSSSFDSVWDSKSSCLNGHNLSVSTSLGYKTDSRATMFTLQGIEAFVLQILQFSGKLSISDVFGGDDTVIATESYNSTIPVVVHLPIMTTYTTSLPPKVFKSDDSVTMSSLHVAASGGLPTFNILRILLAFLLNLDSRVAAQVLVHPMGLRAETPLHAALAEGAAPHALLLLYTLRELQVRTPEIQPLCAQQMAMTNVAGNSVLHLACMWPHQMRMRLVVELLLQEHAEAGNYNNAGFTPLHVALRQQCDETFINLFVQYGQDLDLWTEGERYDDEQDVESSEFPPKAATTLIYACPHNPLMLAVKSQNASAFRSLVRNGARSRTFMPRARVGLLQLAVHLNVRDPELIACLLDDPQLEYSAQSDTADQWGVSPREARSRLMEVWREERSGLNNKDTENHDQSTVATNNTEVAYPRRPPECAASIDLKLPSPHPIPFYPSAEAVSLEMPQYLRTLPQPATLSPKTLRSLREEERATLAIVAHEARSEALDWLAKRIGQKKLLSDAHAQLQNAQKHRRTASGSSSVSTSNNEVDASYVEASGESIKSDQQLLEELKLTAAKKFIDKHVAEAVAEARLSIEREKSTIFQETGLYPGVSSTLKKHRRDDGKHRSLLVRAASSSTGSMLLAASSASVTSLSSEEGNSTHLSDESFGSAGFWWAERAPTFLSDESSFSWLATSDPRGITMLGDPIASTSQSSWASNGIGALLDGSFDGRLTLASRSLYGTAESGRYDDKVLREEGVTESAQLVSE